MGTVWRKFDLEGMDGQFVEITGEDRPKLAAMLQEYADDCEDIEPEFYLERNEATHHFIYVVVPEVEAYDLPHEEYTWWDFGTLLCKQVDGEWYVWCDDVNDVGNTWYQSSYTKAQAYGVREIAIQCASEGCMYRELYVRASAFMGFW